LIATHKFLDAAAACCSAPHIQRAPCGVPLPEDQHPVGEFGSDGQHEACGEAVALRQRGSMTPSSARSTRVNSAAATPTMSGIACPRAGPPEGPASPCPWWPDQRVRTRSLKPLIRRYGRLLAPDRIRPGPVNDSHPGSPSPSCAGTPAIAKPQFTGWSIRRPGLPAAMTLPSRSCPRRRPWPERRTTGSRCQSCPS
jgi:hypothetical protein